MITDLMFIICSTIIIVIVSFMAYDVLTDSDKNTIDYIMLVWALTMYIIYIISVSIFIRNVMTICLIKRGM